MTTSPHGSFEFEIEIEVEAEMTLAESSRPEQITNLPVSEWPFDPVDVERDEIALRNLLGAVEALEQVSETTPRTLDPQAPALPMGEGARSGPQERAPPAS